MLCTTLSLKAARTARRRTYAVMSLRTNMGGRPESATFDDETTIEETAIHEAAGHSVRVISVDCPSATSTVSVFTDAGSRFENRFTLGSSHFLQKLAFRYSTYKSGLRTVRDLEHFGSSFHAKQGREWMEWHTRGPRTGGPALSIALETLNYQLSPLLQEWEINSIRPLVKYDIDQKCPVGHLLDLAHFSGFRDRGLGNPSTCPAWNVDNIDPRHLDYFAFHMYKSVTLVGIGVQHGEFLDTATPIFEVFGYQGKRPEIEDAPVLHELQTDITNQDTEWFGGDVIREPGPGDTRIIVAYPGVTHKSKDVGVFLVLSEIVSAQLARGKAFHIPYIDTGVFAVFSATKGDPKQLSQQLQHVVEKATSSLTAEALQSAKSLAKIKYLSSLEDPYQYAFLLATKGTGAASGSVGQIDGVTMDDMKKVVGTLLKAKSVVVASGNVKDVARE